MVQDLDDDLLEVRDREAIEHFWENPRNVMRLIDLVFMMESPDREKTPS